MAVAESSLADPDLGSTLVRSTAQWNARNIEASKGRRSMKKFAVLLTMIFIFAGIGSGKDQLLPYLRALPDLH
jgi:hypothetical protein